MPGVVSGHRPTTKVANKAFKSRKATKGALRDLAKGKVPTEKGLRKTPHQQVMSKFDRRNQARQRQLNKQRERQKESSIFSGRDAAPRNVAVIPLCEDCDAVAAVRSLNQSLDIEAEIGEGLSRVPVDRFKQKLGYFPVKRDLAACMDAARAADFVVLVLSADVEVDDLGELILRSIEGQGLSTLITTVQGLNKIDPVKQRLSVVDSLKSYIKYYHPEQDKIYSLDNRQECANLMRSICSTTPKGVRWRDERSWMLVEDAQFPPTAAVDGLTVLTGVVRGKGLKADRLVQVGDWGTFQIEKITAAPLSTRKGKSGEPMAVDEDSAPGEPLDVPSEDRDDLAEFAPEEVMMMDNDDGDAQTSASAPTKKGVLLDDHHYFSDDDEGQAPRAKRLPKGTSAYQAAWYLDDGVSDSGSDMEDLDMADATQPERSHGPEDGIEEGMAMDTQTEAGATEYPQSEMFVEPNEDEDARQLEAYRASKRDEAEDDKEFPDEIELHPNVLARERLARYRGLKSLRTSTWEEEEDRAHEPEEWRRLLQVPDYQGSRSRCTREALVGGVAPGTRVSVYLKGVPVSVAQAHDAAKPVAMFSLLRHENKHTAVNFLINLSSEHPTSIKAKEELIMQCGPRRLVIRPLFSEGGNTQNDVHKYSRFLHPGQSAVATFIGPVIWGSVPALFYKRQAPSAADVKDDSDEAASLPLELIATGTALPPSTSRVVAKRVILTGHPYHIHKKIVTIRYMFFNRDDVEWFKALPLWTRRGRSGFVKESLGTHGYFKATFDGKINPQDSVGVSLYKRVWPRKSEPFRGSLLSENDASAAAGGEEAMEDIA